MVIPQERTTIMHSSRIKISRQQLHQIQRYAAKSIRSTMDGDNKLFATKEILNKLIYLIFLKSNSGQFSSHFCTPSMKWLGSQIFRSDETAQRTIKVLVNLHLIHKLTKRQANGRRWIPTGCYIRHHGHPYRRSKMTDN